MMCLLPGCDIALESIEGLLQLSGGESRLYSGASSETGISTREEIKKVVQTSEDKFIANNDCYHVIGDND